MTPTQLSGWYRHRSHSQSAACRAERHSIGATSAVLPTLIAVVGHDARREDIEQVVRLSRREKARDMLVELDDRLVQFTRGRQILVVFVFLRERMHAVRDDQIRVMGS